MEEKKQHISFGEKLEEYSSAKKEEIIEKIGAAIERNAKDLDEGELQAFIEKQMDEYFNEKPFKEVKIEEDKIKEVDSAEYITIYIPYDGEIEVLKVKAEKEEPEILIKGKEIGIKIRKAAYKTKEDAAAERDKVIAEIKADFNSLRIDIKNSDAEIKSSLLKEIDKAKEKLKSNKSRLKENFESLKEDIKKAGSEIKENLKEGIEKNKEKFDEIKEILKR